MPIKHTDKGWFWGSKGPFATKAKALAVARAAYASGYKKEQIMNPTVAEFIGTLLHSSTITHIMHLQVKGPGSYAAHMALGTFYDEIIDLADGIAEAIQGKYGIITGYGPTFALPDGTPLEYLKSLMEYVDEKREEMPADSEIQNDIDAVCTLIDSTVYKLENLA